ncbi:MAG: hypothetical protein FWE73_08610 [Candidatus Bathyarchaeota archaeon]|nr:hypothetical protein [Candidatus Termitimicrobium sp.]
MLNSIFPKVDTTAIDETVVALQEFAKLLDDANIGINADKIGTHVNTVYIRRQKVSIMYR